MKTQQLKLIFAGVGGGAIIATGALGAVFSTGPRRHRDRQPGA
ncbi:hypothetical protein [Mycolicibacterium elephantis]